MINNIKIEDTWKDVYRTRDFKIDINNEWKVVDAVYVNIGNDWKLLKFQSPAVFATGSYHNFFINDIGRAWGWGYNPRGQLGINSIDQKRTPASVMGTYKTFCKINVSYSSSLAIDKNGRLWAWGAGLAGELGDNTAVSKRTPVSVHGNVKTFCEIACDGIGNDLDESAAIDKNGLVWTWGDNTYGQLGNNTVTDRSTPTSILGTKKTICKIAVGNYHTFIINQNGKVWGWGRNTYGFLGDNSVTSRSTPVSILGANKTFCKISAGQYHTAAIDRRGLIWCWGYNGNGQLGVNSVISKRTPVSILGARKTFCEVAVKFHSVGIDYKGQIWGWGYNIHANLGLEGDLSPKSTPVSVLGSKKTFCKIEAGRRHTMAMDYKGNIWVWGHNGTNQLGIGGYNVFLPDILSGSQKTFCKIVPGRGDYTLAIDNRGMIWGWGAGWGGRLGVNASYGSVISPISIHGGNKTFCIISTGQQHSLAIDKNGILWTWGNNDFGQLGNNTITARSTPTSILGNRKTFCTIGTANNMSSAANQNGKVWSWGRNIYGNLGDNSITSRSTPVSILGANKTFCFISSGGRYHLSALDFRGKAWGWGYNNAGQLGDNSITSRRTPVSILGGLKTFCQITAGMYTTTAIDHRGLIWGWGYNSQGELGDNTVTSRRTPVSILGARKTFCKVISGNNHTLAIDKNGKIWAWGNSYYGQLGYGGNIGNRSTPMSLYTNRTFCYIGAAANASYGIEYNGTIWSWGENTSYALGRPMPYGTPVKIIYV